MRSFTWVVVAAACVAAEGRSPAVRPGIAVLLADSLALVAGKRVGLLTNQTGVDAAGTGDLERLLAAGVNVTAIFSPEHGYRGVLDRSNIGDGLDSATGIPIYSLYGASRAPTPAMLAGVEVLVVDLQDIGARGYTYVSTAVLALRAAHEAGRRVVVLDRPNPLGGTAVQGPLLDTALASFIALLPVPSRHGMTLGELVRYADAVLAIGAAPTIVPVEGWHRGDWFDATALPWVRPSPNMPSLESAALYPGLVWFEATNMSVGRGTPIAFQVLAAPWLDPARLSRAVGVVPGITMTDTVVIPRAPTDGKYPDRVLPALRFAVTDRGVYDPLRLALRVLAAVRRLYPDSSSVDARGLDLRVGSSAVREALDADGDPDAIWRGWTRDLDDFRRARAPFLLYRP